MSNIINTLEELCHIPTAFGMESGILDFIEKAYAKNLECSRDGMGNLTVIKRSGREDAVKIMLSASADAKGYIVNYIDEGGFLRVTGLGSPSGVSYAFNTLVSENGVSGFLLSKKGEDIKESDTSNLYIDIGAKDREDTEKKVNLGTIFAAVPTFSKLCGGRIGGNGVASRVPMAMMAELLSEGNTGDADLYFSFTVQGALRDRGAKTAAFDIRPDFCICLDLCESVDTVDEIARGEARLGEGAVILAKTKDFCMPPKLRSDICEFAKSEGISHRVCVYPEKTVKASVIASCGDGNLCAEICLPVRNIGSGAEIFDISDAESVYSLVLKTVKALGKR